MTLFDPVLDDKNTARLAPVDAAFVRVHGILFSGKHRHQLNEAVDTFIGLLDHFINESPKQWLEKGLVYADRFSGLIILTDSVTTLEFQ